MRLLLFTDSASDQVPFPRSSIDPVYVGAAPSIQRESLPMIGRECVVPLCLFRSETGRLVEFWKSSRWAARPVPPDVPSIQNGGLLTLFSF